MSDWASFKKTGYIILPALLGPDQCREALLRVKAIHAAGIAEGKYAPRGATAGLIINLQAKDPWLIGLLENPRLEAALIQMLNDPLYGAIPAGEPNYIVGEFAARSSGIGQLGLHIDSYLPTPGPLLTSATVAIALEDRGVDEGCTVVVPGTHRSGQYPSLDTIMATPLPLNAGDAAIWDGRIWHGHFPRKSDSLCWILLITFQRWWVKQLFDIPGTLPEAIKATLTPKQLALLGFYSVSPKEEGDQIKRGYGLEGATAPDPD